MKERSTCFAKNLPIGVLCLLAVPIVFVAQGWSFTVYRVGFMLIWPLMIVQIIVGNSGPSPSCRTLAKVAALVGGVIGVLVVVAIYATPVLV